MVSFNSKFLAVLMPFYDLGDFIGYIQLEPISVLKPLRNTMRYGLIQIELAVKFFMLFLHLSTKSTPIVDGFYSNFAKVLLNGQLIRKHRHNKPLVKATVEAGKCLKKLRS